MKKIIAKYFIVILAAIMLLTGNTIMYAGDINTEDMNAENGISPCFSQCNQCSFGFYIDGNGTAHVSVSYDAKSTFTQAKSTVKIQKKFLGFFWRTVDIGYSNNEWIAYSSEDIHDFYNTFSLNGSGTYKAVFKLEMYGSGNTDVIEDEVQYTY